MRLPDDYEDHGSGLTLYIIIWFFYVWGWVYFVILLYVGYWDLVL